jgi:hypothetical protein
MIKIRVDGYDATLTGYCWECENPEVLASLKCLARMCAPGAQAPSPEKTIYEGMKSLIGPHELLRYAPENLGGDSVEMDPEDGVETG